MIVAALLGITATQAEGINMDDKLHQEIVEAVHSEYGWKTAEVQIDEVERLRHGACAFYTARSTVRPLSYQPNYAVLNDREVVGIGDHNAVRKILDACSQNASAEWWAEVIARFHHEVGGGVVLTSESVRPDIVRNLSQKGKAFTPPTFSDDKTSVSFLLLNPETYVVYNVKATRTTSGEIEVVETQLLGNPSKREPAGLKAPA